MDIREISPFIAGKKINIIAAMSENRVIGRDNRLPWHMPADLRHFREVTDGKPFIMGRNSYVSEDVLLSTYKSVILSHKDDIALKQNCYQANNFKAAFSLLRDDPEIFILGGENVYRQAVPVTDYIFLTVMHTLVKGDAYFPDINPEDWEIVGNNFHYSDKDNPHDYSFMEYKRKA